MVLLENVSPPVEALKRTLETFVHERCQPAELEYNQHVEKFVGASRWTMEAVPPCMDRLKKEARQLGLWNLFLPHPLPDALLSNNNNNNNNDDRDGNASIAPTLYLSNREYGILCEIMGRSFLAPEACNCSAPDTGNMEVFLKHGTVEQQRMYAKPLLNGVIRSAFLMTEPDVASSDATNIETKLTKIINHKDNGSISYILNGKKWWSTGAMDPRCKVALVLAKMDYSHPSCTKSSNHTNNSKGRHGIHTVVVVPMEKIKMVRALTVFGHDDAPHGHAEVAMENIILDSSSLILGEGRGFEIAQSRLGPGRIHHCMRAVGMAARCYELMLERSMQRQTFGKLLYEHGGCQEMIADSASDLEAARLLTLDCAAAIDEFGAHQARDKIASIKFAVPELTSRVVDRAVQVFGGAGVSSDFPLAKILVGLRTLRIADGPDAVHKRTLALLEIKKAKKMMAGKCRL
mmetsp:Transcript_19864/g.19107  ORF Transcript_19864/g.19107 Transcript_19864/m.19107 type:complete len:461 (-) Transcript_19864:37-1419(-)